ncbi:CaiB/BaiF CoA transferase family protein [Edaphobacillus lindanitolerans]|uniref:Crotonobetainyl-CoA:carnitine CoA-transferase CaiB n=1 Tax=Edaphobacillus lindanitolerans TaxID=550447 RepID=A0A1U7PP40_9BACI|nr:CaiB/BaiF CoA-transferase family protein [Edaphobacillus lindanitolerans]SIT74899.1 Crotonobetainyl-CoA:carnitine CoA-transferase CaiB [Edaphobacillus lindanitolerans]
MKEISDAHPASVAATSDGRTGLVNPGMPEGRFLDGIRVIDLTYYLPGPHAAWRLTEMGADTVKVEPPGGEPSRKLGGGVVHEANNGGKKIVELNLKAAEGCAALQDLVREADVLIESFRPGTLERLGFGEAELARLNPGLIYCSMTGYGQAGPFARAGSHDLNYLALSGVLSQLADENGRPVHPLNTIADYAGGLSVSEGVCAALVRKMQTGRGARLDVSITDVLAGWQGVHLAYRAAGLSDRGIPGIDGSLARYSIYETSDGRHVVLAALEEKFWHAFCDYAGHPEWKGGDERCGGPVHMEVADHFRSRPHEHWLNVSLETDFCLTPVLRPGELDNHPHWRGRTPLA